MPRTGRPPRRDPVTAEEAVVELARYGIRAHASRVGDVVLTVADVNALTARLRKRRVPKEKK